MNNKWATLGLAAVLGLAAGCNKGDTSTNPSSTDNSQQGAGQSTASQQPAPAPEPPKPIVVPAGTPVTVVLSTTISSRVAKPGDDFEATVAEPVIVGGEVAIPKGTHVAGTVVNAKKQGAFKGEAVLSIRLTRIEVTEGHDRDGRVRRNTKGQGQAHSGRHRRRCSGRRADWRTCRRRQGSRNWCRSRRGRWTRRFRGNRRQERGISGGVPHCIQAD